jgi:hypothetical protein
MTKAKYKPFQWKNTSVSCIDPTHIKIVDLEDDRVDINIKDAPWINDVTTTIGRYEEPKKISYICRNCNGHINPITMKCEYCDTQY